MTAPTVYKRCVQAIGSHVFIRRVSAQDKEFHFQNWFEGRLKETGLNFERGGRNSYPDFRMVKSTDGYEVKGLAYPGREASFDSNSQVPSGSHNGRTIYYVFGRYPKESDGDSYPVIDLVICHGDFLNADHEYVHRNKSVRAFGSYGDILIRDRKMYVVPTPFNLVEGTAHHRTLILPKEAHLSNEFISVGEIVRCEAENLVVGYSFDLKSNEIKTKTVPNPDNGREHKFTAWRLKGDSPSKVSLREETTLDSSEADEDE